MNGSSPPRRLAGPRPDRGAERLADHRARLGPLPSRAARADVIDSLDASGLLGRGGAGYPVGQKWRAVARRASGHAVVVANGAEGEPKSWKDRVLMAARPHLVIDGALIAADAVGADEIILYVGAEHAAARQALSLAIAERQPELKGQLRLASAPHAFIAGEASAAVRFINEGDARPTSKPPRPFEAGVGGRPTLVQNVESLAHTALIARFGPEWYRGAGSGPTGGTCLVTVAGAVRAPLVREIEYGTSLAEVVGSAGGVDPGAHAVLLGGYFGAWLDVGEAPSLPLDPVSMGERGLGMGSGVIHVLGPETCGVVETARVMGYMAGQSAGQCGPCVFGLGAIAAAAERLALGTAAADDLARIERWAAQLVGRGACHHPDGAVRFVASAISVFAGEFRLHQSRRCSVPASVVTAMRAA
jgi:NADH:ubiquinone oxidoreductase subunit F (NADH-binding)